REERLLRSRGAGAPTRRHAEAAADARGDPARARRHRGPGTRIAALAARRLADPRVGHDRSPRAFAEARSRLAGRRPRDRRAAAGRPARCRRGVARRLPRLPAGTRLLEPGVRMAIDVREAFRIHRSGGATSVALQGLTLQVDEGEIVVVLGPSGSGKTTLLRTVAAFDTLSAGTARVLGVDVGSLGSGAVARFRAENL